MSTSPPDGALGFPVGADTSPSGGKGGVGSPSTRGSGGAGSASPTGVSATHSPGAALSPQSRATMIANLNSEAFPLAAGGSPGHHTRSLSGGSPRAGSDAGATDGKDGDGVAPSPTRGTSTPATSGGVRRSPTAGGTPPHGGTDSKDADAVGGSPGSVARRLGGAPLIAHQLPAGQEDAGKGAAATAGAASVPPGSGASATAIPKFYVPGEGGRGRGRPMPADALSARLPAIVDLFRHHCQLSPDTLPPPPRATNVAVSVGGVRLTWEEAHLGLPVEHFAAVAKTLCGFPSFFAAPLFRRVRASYRLAGVTESDLAPAVADTTAANPTARLLATNAIFRIAVPPEATAPSDDSETWVVEL